MGAQVRNLRDDVLKCNGAHALGAGQFGVAGRDDVLGRRAVPEPARDVGHRLQARGISQRLHRAAVRVAAHDDVADAERHHGVLDRRGDTAVVGGIGRHDVARVAADKQVAGLGLHDLLGDDARIRAGNHQRLGRLTMGGKFPEQLTAGRKDGLLEMEDATNEFVHVSSPYIMDRATRHTQAPRLSPNLCQAGVHPCS